MVEGIYFLYIIFKYHHFLLNLCYNWYADMLMYLYER